MDAPTPSPRRRRESAGCCRSPSGTSPDTSTDARFVARCSASSCPGHRSFVAVGGLAAGSPSALLTLLAIPAFILGAGRRERSVDDFAPIWDCALPQFWLGLESVLLAAMWATALACGQNARSRSAGRIVGRYVRSVPRWACQNAFVSRT